VRDFIQTAYHYSNRIGLEERRMRNSSCAPDWKRFWRADCGWKSGFFVFYFFFLFFFKNVSGQGGRNFLLFDVWFGF